MDRYNRFNTKALTPPTPNMSKNKKHKSNYYAPGPQPELSLGALSFLARFDLKIPVGKTIYWENDPNVIIFNYLIPMSTLYKTQYSSYEAHVYGNNTYREYPLFAYYQNDKLIAKETIQCRCIKLFNNTFGKDAVFLMLRDEQNNIISKSLWGGKALDRFVPPKFKVEIE